MSDEETSNIKTRLLTLFFDLGDGELDQVEQWISSQSYKKDLEKMKSINKSKKLLEKISFAVKKLVPFEAELPTENITKPTIGDQADCTDINTCHVDEFLYDDEAVEQLVKEGKLNRHYCINCNSRNIKDLIYVSHSMSINILHYVFKVLLPADLDGKQLLDVGSRFGGVLFAAYYLTNVSSIVGVEINKECCEVQENIKSKFSMDSNRIRIENFNIMERKDIVQNSNVIVVNVLDFFVDPKIHKDIWCFLHGNIKKGSYIVTNRGMPETLMGLGIYEDFMEWLSVCKPCQLENDILFDIEDYEHADLHLYIVN